VVGSVWMFVSLFVCLFVCAIRGCDRILGFGVTNDDMFASSVRLACAVTCILTRTSLDHSFSLAFDKAFQSRNKAPEWLHGQAHSVIQMEFASVT
jgi:hypothetical protein